MQTPPKPGILRRAGPAIRAQLLALLLAAAAGGAMVGAAGAQESDGIAADRLLTDRDFFRLATCGAPPGGECTGPVLRWPKRVVTLAILPGETDLPDGFADSLGETVDEAIAQINRTGAGIRIRRVEGQKADICVIPTAMKDGDRLEDVAGLSAAGIMGVGYMTYWWNGRNEITEATILISTAIIPGDMRSVVLEETFQTLGPRFDIEGKAYEGLSILSQTSNQTMAIRGQDARLLRWLYPPARP